jgi:hypothetical protein
MYSSEQFMCRVNDMIEVQSNKKRTYVVFGLQKCSVKGRTAAMPASVSVIKSDFVSFI